MKNFILTILLIFLTCTVAHTKTLYVNATLGNDSTTYTANDATHPWATLGRAVWGSTSMISPNSSQAAQAGDTVLVSPGIYSTTESTGSRNIPIYNPVNSGTSGNYITFQCTTNYGCDLRVSNDGTGEPVFGTHEKNYIKWAGFFVDQNNMKFVGDSGLISVKGSHHVEILNNECQGRYWNNPVPSNNHSCIRIEYVQDSVFRNNKLHGIYGNNSSNDNAIQVYTSGNILIENNTIYDTQNGIFLKLPLNISPVSSNGTITIRYNYIYHTGDDPAGGRAGIMIARAIDGNIYQNLIKDCGVGFGISFLGRSADPSPQNYTIANNTIDNCYAGIQLATLVTPNSNKVFNNIITNSTYAILAEEVNATEPRFESNLYYGYTTFSRVYYVNYNFANWKTSFSHDTVSPASLNSDPLFSGANDYRLQSGSPARNAGIDILDLNNNGSTTDLINLGAYVTGNEVIGVQGLNLRIVYP